MSARGWTCGLLLLAACAAEPAEVPDFLTGAWSSDAPRYKGRVFEVDKQRLRFHAGDGQVQVYLIRSIDGGGAQDVKRFRVGYEDPADPEITGTLTIRYRESKQELVLRDDARVIWHRLESD